MNNLLAKMVAHATPIYPKNGAIEGQRSDSILRKRK